MKSLYIHFPFCVHLCNYCDFYKHKLVDSSQIDSFEKLLAQGWERHQDWLSEQQEKMLALSTLYLGGGTPSLWSKRGALYFKNFIKSHLTLAPDLEFTMEVDPGTCSKEDLIAWKECGVNRISVGAQAFDDDYLKILDRRHRVRDIKNLMKMLSELELEFSLDFLIGAPENEVPRNITRELESALTFGPVHFSLYILQARANYPHIAAIPADDRSAEEYLQVSDFLTKKGFSHYEVSNFAKEGKKSRHNQTYWRSESVGALGPNATGFINQGKVATRYQWKSMSADFQIEPLGAKELKLERVYLALRTDAGLTLSDVFNTEECLQMGVILESWKTKGLIAHSCSEKWVLNPRGYLLLDSLINDFFALNLL